MRFRVSAIVLMGLLLVVPREVFAQGRGGGDVAVGYNALYIFGEDGGPGVTLPAGFFVSGAGRIGRGNVMLVGEVADSTKSETSFGASSTSSILTFTGGVRIMGEGGRRGPREGARPFVEILVGGAHSSASVAGVTFLTGDGLAIQPGAGVDLPVGRRTAVRIAGKFELFHNSAGDDHAFRVDVGIAFHMGRR